MDEDEVLLLRPYSTAALIVMGRYDRATERLDAAVARLDAVGLRLEGVQLLLQARIASTESSLDAQRLRMQNDA